MSTARQTSEQLRAAIALELGRIEEDAEYSGKGHFNAADRWQYRYLWLGIPNAVIAGLASISAFQDCTILAGVLAMCAAALAAIITFLGPNDRATNHKRSASEYLTLRNRCRIFRDITMGRLSDDDELQARFDELAQRRDDLTGTCPQIPQWAFEKARKGIEAGEAKYRVDRRE